VSTCIEFVITDGGMDSLVFYSLEAGIAIHRHKIGRECLALDVVIDASDERFKL